MHQDDAIEIHILQGTIPLKTFAITNSGPGHWDGACAVYQYVSFINQSRWMSARREIELKRLPMSPEWAPRRRGRTNRPNPFRFNLAVQGGLAPWPPAGKAPADFPAPRKQRRPLHFPAAFLKITKKDSTIMIHRSFETVHHHALAFQKGVLSVRHHFLDVLVSRIRAVHHHLSRLQHDVCAVQHLQAAFVLCSG